MKPIMESRELRLNSSIRVHPHVTSSTDTTIGLIVGLLLGVAGGFGSITTAGKKPKSTEL